MDYLYKKTTWINSNIDYLFGTNIIEYDIKSAGLSIIKQYNLLSNDSIEELEKMDKTARNIKIGLLQKNDKTLVKGLLNGFEYARKMFIESNELTEGDIVSIKKDAIFVLDKRCKELEFDNIVFIEKNKYSTYLNLNKLEFYISTRDDIVDIKGLGQGNDLDNIIDIHGKYTIDFILTFSKMREKIIDRKDMCYWLTDFIKKYRLGKLELDYYRELNKESKYRLLSSDDSKESVAVDYVDSFDKLDIRYNYLNYIVPLAGLYV